MNFNPQNIKTLPLSERISKSNIEDILVNPDQTPPPSNNLQIIQQLAQQIKQARANNKPVIITFGAHLIKNGLSPIIIKLIQQGLITHLATNGAGSIHDWELAFHGKTEEDVRHYAQKGQFGLWTETGKYLNQAIIDGANNNLGYGESIGKMIYEEELIINKNIDNLIQDKSINPVGEDNQKNENLNESNLTDISNLRNSPTNVGYGAEKVNNINNSKEDINHQENENPNESNLGDINKMRNSRVQAGYEAVPHPHKALSLQATAFKHNIPFTVHPCLGQDIIHISPYCNFEAIGKTAQIDFNRFINSVLNLEGGIYISIGSAIMSPMIFEKAISVARNIAHQNNQQITDFSIIINDIHPSGDWNWNSNQDPPKTSPAYYLRFCKTFNRMGAREIHYIQEDNRTFLMNLYKELQKT